MLAIDKTVALNVGLPFEDDPTPAQLHDARVLVARRAAIDHASQLVGKPAVGSDVVAGAVDAQTRIERPVEDEPAVLAQAEIKLAAGRAERESYLPHVSITCLMDMGNGAAYVHRDAAKEQMVPLPVVGHWMKQGWGAYYKLSKRKVVPRIPGM